MSFSRQDLFLRLTAAAALILTTWACSRTRETEVERVAILPLENLSSDASLDWFGRAASSIAASAVRQKPLGYFEVSSLRDAQSVRATQILEGYFTIEAGVVHAYAVLRDENTRENVKSITASGAPEKVIDFGNALARQIASDIRPYTTSSNEAVRSLFTGDAAKAVEADSGYGVAYLVQIQELLREGARDRAAAAIEAARRSRMTEAERAQLDLLAAGSDANARLAALKRVAETSPTDPQVWRAVAEIELNAKNYRAAAQAYDRVLEFSPEDQVILNSSGYALAFAGDFEGARSRLERYRKIAPENANPIDSLAEVHFLFGRYADAERLFLEAHQKDPGVLRGFEPFRAAFSAYLAGDRTRADEDMQRFLEARRKTGDELVDIRKALWLTVTGRSPDLKPSTAPEQATSALLLLGAGQRDRARQLAESARRNATAPAAVAFASSVLVLAQPSGTAETWRARISRAVSGPEHGAARRQLLGYALLLDGRFNEAAEVWREIYDSTPGLSVNESRIALVWALTAAGHSDQARELMPHGFLPPAVLDPGPNILLFRKAAELRQGRS